MKSSTSLALFEEARVHLLRIRAVTQKVIGAFGDDIYLIAKKRGLEIFFIVC